MRSLIDQPAALVKRSWCRPHTRRTTIKIESSGERLLPVCRSVSIASRCRFACSVLLTTHKGVRQSDYLLSDPAKHVNLSDPDAAAIVQTLQLRIWCGSSKQGASQC